MTLRSSLTVFVETTEYDLSYGGVSYWDDDDGFGMPPLHRLKERGPLQDGSTDVGFRLDERIIQLVLPMAAMNEAGLERKRDRMLGIFKPRDTALRLRHYRADGTKRQIDCHVIADPKFSRAERGEGMRSWVQRSGVTLEASNPIWYDPDSVTVSYGITAGTGAFTVPMAVPTGVGSATVDQTKTITYDGNWREYPVITIVGPITDPVITNDTTGDVLDFTGAILGGSDIYTIDLRYGVKTITDQAGTDQISKLSDASDLATWSLEPHPDAIDGENNISVTGSAATSATDILITYYLRYIGS